MRQRGGHFAHRRQPLVAFGVGFQFVRHGDVVDQQQAATGRVKRAFGDGYTPSTEFPFVGRVRRFEAFGGQLRPVTADNRPAEQCLRRRVGLVDHRCAVKHHDPGGQGIEQQRQAFGKGFLFLILATQFTIGDGQFAGQRFHPGLQGFIGLGQLQRNPVEHGKSPL